MNIQWIRPVAGTSAYGGRPEAIADFSGPSVSRYLAHLQRADALGRSLRVAWPRRSIDAELEVLNLLYVPDRSLRVVGRFFGTGEEDLIVCLEVFPGEQAEKRCLDALVAGVRPDCIAHLPEWGLVALAFPADPDIPGLPGMTDLVRVGDLLGLPGGNCDSLSWSLLSYLPGKRCALRYRFGDRTFVGKFQRDPVDAAKAHERQLQLWSHPGRRFRMPRPVACCPQLGARFETFLAASPMELALGSGPPSPLAAVVVGELVKLHRLELPGLSRLGPDVVLNRIERRILPRLESVLPGCSARARELAAELQAKASWALCACPVMVHGDFHLANFLLDDRGMVFIDLDELAVGDPCYDLSLFGSRLLLRQLNHGEHLAETMRAVAELPVLYVEAGGRSIQPCTFAWYMAALLIGRQVKSCIRDDAPHKARLVATLLRWAEATLARGYFPNDLES